MIMYCRGHGLSRPETGRDRCESRLTRSRCKACFVPIKRPPSKDGGCLLSLSCLRTASPPLRAASSSHVSAPLRRSVRRIVTDPADLTSPTLHVVQGLPRFASGFFVHRPRRLSVPLFVDPSSMSFLVDPSSISSSSPSPTDVASSLQPVLIDMLAAAVDTTAAVPAVLIDAHAVGADAQLFLGCARAVVAGLADASPADTRAQFAAAIAAACRRHATVSASPACMLPLAPAPVVKPLVRAPGQPRTRVDGSRLAGAQTAPVVWASNRLPLTCFGCGGNHRERDCQAPSDVRAARRPGLLPDPVVAAAPHAVSTPCTPGAAASSGGHAVPPSRASSVSEPAPALCAAASSFVPAAAVRASEGADRASQARAHLRQVLGSERAGLQPDFIESLQRTCALKDATTLSAATEHSQAHEQAMASTSMARGQRAVEASPSTPSEADLLLERAPKGVSADAALQTGPEGARGGLVHEQAAVQRGCDGADADLQASIHALTLAVQAQGDRLAASAAAYVASTPPTPCGAASSSSHAACERAVSARSRDAGLVVKKAGSASTRGSHAHGVSPTTSIAAALISSRSALLAVLKEALSPGRGDAAPSAGLLVLLSMLNEPRAPVVSPDVFAMLNVLHGTLSGGGGTETLSPDMSALVAALDRAALKDAPTLSTSAGQPSAWPGDDGQGHGGRAVPGCGVSVDAVCGRFDARARVQGPRCRRAHGRAPVVGGPGAGVPRAHGAWPERGGDIAVYVQ